MDETPENGSNFQTGISYARDLPTDINNHPPYLNAASCSQVRSISLNCRKFFTPLSIVVEMMKRKNHGKVT